MPLTFRDANQEVEKVKQEPKTSPRAPTHTHPPLDLSFKCLLSASEIKEEVENHSQENLPRSQDSTKFASNAIRLNNNSLSDLTKFDEIIANVIENPEEIAWIDLSFNELTSIDKVLTKFQNLRVLYLHGNTIEKIQDVGKLAALPQLRSLTLHGNPIETEKGYRQYVLSVLPGLKTLDFSGVTKQDRSTALTWRAMNASAFRKRRNSTE